MTTPAGPPDLRELLTGARIWGLELDTGFRVLAATLEVEPAAHPDGPEVEDARLQVLLHPVARVAALLTRPDADGRTAIEQFEEAQLPLVVDRFDGPVPQDVAIDAGTPEPGTWAPELSLEGISNAPDGRSRTLELTIQADDGRRLRLAAWFDEVELRRPDGSTVGDSGTGLPFG